MQGIVAVLPHDDILVLRQSSVPVDFRLDQPLIHCHGSLSARSCGLHCTVWPTARMAGDWYIDIAHRMVMQQVRSSHEAIAARMRSIRTM